MVLLWHHDSLRKKTIFGENLFVLFVPQRAVCSVALLWQLWWPPSGPFKASETLRRTESNYTNSELLTRSARARSVCSGVAEVQRRPSADRA